MRPAHQQSQSDKFHAKVLMEPNCGDIFTSFPIPVLQGGHTIGIKNCAVAFWCMVMSRLYLSFCQVHGSANSNSWDVLLDAELGDPIFTGLVDDNIRLSKLEFYVKAVNFPYVPMDSIWFNHRISCNYHGNTFPDCISTIYRLHIRGKAQLVVVWSWHSLYSDMSCTPALQELTLLWLPTTPTTRSP